MTETQPEGMETKDTGGGHTYVAGAEGDERQIGYSPAAVPNRDGMADGLTPGTTNTPGPYTAPAKESTSGGPKSTGKRGGAAAKSSTPAT